MASKFAQFLKDNKIDPRRLLVASRGIERLQTEDRKLKLEKRRAKSAAGGQPAAAEGEDKKAPQKPRSGRPVTSRVLEAASEGKTLPAPTKQRILRALNRVLEQKKKSVVDLRAIF